MRKSEILRQDRDISVDSAEAEIPEPPSYAEPPQPVEIEIACSPVSEEISSPWLQEPVITSP